MKKTKLRNVFFTVFFVVFAAAGCVTTDTGRDISGSIDSSVFYGKWAGEWRNWDEPGSALATLEVFPEGGKLKYTWGVCESFNILSPGSVIRSHWTEGDKLFFLSGKRKFSFKRVGNELKGAIDGCPEYYITLKPSPKIFSMQ